MRRGGVVTGVVTAIILGLIAYQGAWLWFGHRGDQIHDVAMEIFQFNVATRSWVLYQHRLPESDFKSFVTTLCRYYPMDQYCPMIVKNRDAWGHPFVYELEDGGRKIILRSCGPNGRDDGGRGDDIHQKTLLLPENEYPVKEPGDE